MAARGFGAGHYPAGFGELRALLPFWQGPDILGMCRGCPAGPGDYAGIPGQGGGRMQKMGMQPGNIGREFSRQPQCLAEAADAIWGWVTPQIRKPSCPRPTVAALSA